MNRHTSTSLNDPEIRIQQRESTPLPLFESRPTQFEAARIAQRNLLLANTPQQGQEPAPVKRGYSPDQIAHARRTDPQTSHQAAASVINLGPVREGILQLLREYGPMADEEIINRYRDCASTGKFKNASDQSIRSRRAELTRYPFNAIESCGAKKSPWGNNTTIWQLAQSGEDEMEQARRLR